jgi:hypothetical protein
VSTDGSQDIIRLVYPKRVAMSIKSLAKLLRYLLDATKSRAYGLHGVVKFGIIPVANRNIHCYFCWVPHVDPG